MSNTRKSQMAGLFNTPQVDQVEQALNVLGDNNDQRVSRTKTTRKKAKTGKRSDPAYEQIGVYIPIKVNLKCKQRLLGKEQDMSDLVTELLTKWLSE